MIGSTVFVSSVFGPQVAEKCAVQNYFIANIKANALQIYSRLV